MTRVSCWMPLLLVVGVVWEAYHIIKLKDEISLLKSRETRAVYDSWTSSNCQKEKGRLTDRIRQVEADSSYLRQQQHQDKMKLEQLNVVNSDLKKQLQSKEEVLKSNIDKQKQLQTTVDDLTKTVESLNQRLQVLCEPPEFACRSLLEAAKSGDANSTKRLVKCSGDKSNGNCASTDRFGFTPLIYAARNGHVEVVRVLLESGANLESSGVSGGTALHQAARQEHLEVCRLLLDWGANVDSLNDGRETPLHLASKHGHLSVVKLLVEKGADLGLKNGIGQTALHDAARWGHLSVVKLLVQTGADISVRNDKGLTAREVARWQEKIEVAEWLQSVTV